MLQVVIDGAPCEMRKGSTICPGAGFHCSMRDSRNRVLGEASIFHPNWALGLKEAALAKTDRSTALQGGRKSRRLLALPRLAADFCGFRSGRDIACQMACVFARSATLVVSHCLTRCSPLRFWRRLSSRSLS